MQLNDIPLTPVTLKSGVVLNYVRDGNGPVMILIHGAMGDWRSWQPQWDLFRKHFDCISYSRRFSFPNPNCMPSPDHSALVDAEDLEGFMDALGLDKAILVGSSYGGFTALAMAVRAPQRVLALVAVEPPMMRYAEMTEEGARIAAEFRKATAEPARDAFARGNDAEGAMILTGGIAGRQSRDLSPAGMGPRLQNAKAARMLALSSDEFPLLPPEALRSLTMPILLMSGATTAPVHAAIFASVAATLTQAKTLIVEGSGHSVSREKSETFNAETLAFLSKSLGLTLTPSAA